MDLKEEEILGSRIGEHWYYISKGRALRRLLGGISVDGVLDVGAGSGVFSRQLLDQGIAREAVCIDPFYEREFSEDHGGKPISFTRQVETVPEGLVLLMDVMEHVDDDEGLLRYYVDRAARGTWFVITVPAFEFLWSAHDVFLEHKRRYTLKQIEAVARASGLNVLRGRYFYGALFPLIAAMRLASRRKLRDQEIEPKSDLRAYPAPVNTTLTLVHDLERLLLFPLNRLAGLTAFVLAQKP